MLEINENSIKDDELRVLGRPTGTRRGFRPYHAALFGLALAAVVLTVLLLCRNRKPAPDFYDVAPADTTATGSDSHVLAPIGDYSDTLKAYTEHVQMVVNDIPLDIYIPHNALPRLFIGTPELTDRRVIFTTQAADIRADNGKINGAFVIGGVPKAWGLSKKGYCGIIDGKISVGVADNSPLFEEATEKGGYFFRQYPLVKNGDVVENEPKGKAVRKAICDRRGEILVVMTSDRESFHDFSQALVDLGVQNAVYLVGGASYGYFRDKFDQLAVIYEKQRGGQKYENHIQWVTP